MNIAIYPENGFGAHLELPVIPTEGSTVVVRREYGPTRTFVITGAPIISWCEGDGSVDVTLSGREID